MNWKYFVLLGIAFFTTISVFFFPAIPQDPAYHNFADQRTFFGIPNFFNVISNLPYLIFGLIGYLFLLKEAYPVIINSLKHAYLVFFIGVSLVCFGSGYYHLFPNNNTLLWDRLPMTLAFMSFFTVIFAEHVDEKKARAVYFPLVIIGIVSVAYWYWTELAGAGDLRLYGLVQFLPMILIPIILWLFASQYSHTHYFWLMIGCYLLAKVFEATDQIIYDTIAFSGHSLKHLVSSIAPYLFYLALRSREAQDTDN